METYSCAVHGADLETRGVVGADLLLELFGVRKGVVPQVDIALECERKLAVGEELGRGVFMVEPGEDGLEGVQSPVESEHQIRRCRFNVVCYSHLG